MSAALSPIPPIVLRDILVKDGFSVVRETDYNWTLFKEDSPRPVITLPKKGSLVSVTVMMEILDQIKMNNERYFDLLNQAKN